MQKYSVYVLLSEKDGKHYTGISRDVQNRLQEHNAGRVKSTKGRIPFRIVFQEEVGTLREARDREKQLKSHAGRDFLKRELEN
jgi:putative endonuclease